jgi:hypothetical protein
MSLTIWKIEVGKLAVILGALLIVAIAISAFSGAMPVNFAL